MTAMFPDTTHVTTKIVRVGTRRWKSRHDEIVEALTSQIEDFLADHADADLTFDELHQEFQRCDPYVKVGNHLHAHILYGPRTLFLDDNGRVSVEIRGLVYKPVSIVAEFDGRAI